MLVTGPEPLLQRPISLGASLEQRKRAQRVISEICNYLVCETKCEWN